MRRQNSLIFTVLIGALLLSGLAAKAETAPPPADALSAPEPAGGLSLYVVLTSIDPGILDKATVGDLQLKGLLGKKADMEIHELVSVQLKPQKSISRLMNADGTVKNTEVINGYAVAIELKPEDAKKFATLTTNNVGRQILISFNGKPLIAPAVLQPILGPTLQISMSKKEDAESLNTGLGMLVAK